MDRLSLELKLHPDQEFVRYLYCGLPEGFDASILFVSLPSKKYKNFLSARQNPLYVLIEKECQNGFFYGPFGCSVHNQTLISEHNNSYYTLQ